MKINEKYVVKNIAGDTVIVPTGNAIQNFNGLISTNEVAGFIWRHLEECRTPEEMVALVLSEYDGEPERIKEDVIGFLNTLREMGMIFF